MLDEYLEVQETLKYIFKRLSLMVCNDGEDITYYNAVALDDIIINLIEARSLMSVAENIIRLNKQ